MKIAVASQNRKIITEHAGRCRKFWIYSIEDGQVVEKELLELPKEQAFHETAPNDPHPLDGTDILIVGGMGSGLVMRLQRKNIRGLVTKESDPDKAVELYLSGSLKTEQPEAHGHHHHHHDHGG